MEGPSIAPLRRRGRARGGHAEAAVASEVRRALGCEHQSAQIWAAPQAGISRECLHLGPVAGDIMRVKLASLPDAEAVISGPPCPPVEQHRQETCCGG